MPRMKMVLLMYPNHAYILCIPCLPSTEIMLSFSCKYAHNLCQIQVKFRACFVHFLLRQCSFSLAHILKPNDVLNHSNAQCPSRKATQLQMDHIISIGKV